MLLCHTFTCGLIWKDIFGTRPGESGSDAYTICKLMGNSNIQIAAR